jgi:cation diffusion facilitator family transporter
MSARRLSTVVLLSVAAALVTLALKSAAAFLTGSVGLLSEAAESVVNLAAALVAYISLRYAAKPVDLTHTYGHEKIEYFASGLEGGLILVAAVVVGIAACQRLMFPQTPNQLGLGMAAALLAAAINGVVGVILLRVGRRHDSIVLEADGRHLLTDVWTSLGVVFGLGLVWLTGWDWLDPIVGLGVAANILWTGSHLLRRSFDGLMDHALPEAEQHAVRAAIQKVLGSNMAFHALRTRQAGARKFVDFHLLVPGYFSVRRAHDLGNHVEDAVRAILPSVEVTVHLEPIEEPTAWSDSELLPLEKALRPDPGLEPRP